MLNPGASLAQQGIPLPPVRGQAQESAALPDGISRSLGRILRPQAAYRWLLPQLAAITPQYIEMTLRGALAGNHVQAWELFDLMQDSWPELAAVCNELVEGVLRKKAVFDPYCDEGEKPTPDATLRQKLVSAAMRRMRPDAASDENDFRGTIKDILAGWFQGQVVLEIGYQRVNVCGIGSVIGPKSTYWVHPVCYAWDMSGRLGLRVELNALRENSEQAQASRGAMTTPWNYVTAQPMPSQISPFPDCKFLIGICKGKSGTALGGARLRALAWWWCAANFSADWLLNLAQIFGLPFRWASYDPNAPQATIDAVCNMLQNMGSAGWAAFPAGTTLEMKEAGKTGDSSPQGNLLDRADRYARSLILGQTLTGANTSAKGGGLAFGETEAGVKSDRIDAAAEYAAGVINTQLIPFILRLNFGDDECAPALRFLQDGEGTVSDAQRDQILAAAGLKIGANFLRRKYNIPAVEEGEETIGGAPASATTPQLNGQTFITPPRSVDPAKPIESRAALTTADAPPAPSPKAKELLLTAIQSDFETLNKRLDAASKITDPDQQRAKLAAVLADLDAFRKNLDHDPAIANAIYKVMATGFANGLAERGDSVAVQAGDVEGHEFRGNQYVELADEGWKGSPKEMHQRASETMRGFKSARHPVLGEVQFTGMGRDKTLFDKRTPHEFQSAQALPELISKGTLVKSVPDRKGRPEIKAFHTLEHGLKIGAAKYKAEITIKEHTDGRRQVNTFYLHRLHEEK